MGSALRWAVVLGLALALAGCAHRNLGPPEVVRILYVSQAVGWTHETVACPEDGISIGCLSISENAMIQMAAHDDGLIVVGLTRDARDITPESLNGIDVLVFNTTGALPISRETWAAILAWIESGRGGFVGIHSATDTALDFEGGAEAWTGFIGGRFDGHPWTQGTPIRLANLEPGHPLAAMWPDRTDYAEEIYQYADFRPDEVRVLQTLDMSAGPLRRPYPVPVAWVKPVGRGRLFYTNLGHTPSTWDDPRFRAQVATAVRWAAGRIDAPTASNPDVQDRAALMAFFAAENLEPMTPADPRTAADAIRALQELHPERENADPAAWSAALARARALIQGPPP